MESWQELAEKRLKETRKRIKSDIECGLWDELMTGNGGRERGSCAFDPDPRGALESVAYDLAKLQTFCGELIKLLLKKKLIDTDELTDIFQRL